METAPGDVILIHHKGNPMTYARVEKIEADEKPGWWQLTLMLLTMPTTMVTWILRDVYIDGEEFTMGGDEMRLERLARPEAWDPKDHKPEPAKDEDTGSDSGQQGGGKVVELFPRKKD